jgi:hypothetical protein
MMEQLEHQVSEGLKGRQVQLVLKVLLDPSDQQVHKV